MFEHSVKVPRHYKIAAKIFKKVSTEGGSVKTLLYDDKLRHFRTDVLYALITETIKHAADIDKIFEHCKLLESEPRFDPWLAKILTAELLFGKKSLPSKSKPEQTILSYKEQFEKYASEHQDDLKTEDIPRPRYVRINTNLLTTSDAIRVFQDEGYRFIRCTSGSYDDYLKQIRNLKEDEFTQDYHVKTIFVFPHGTKWHNHELYLENQIILQDKATALAVHLLAPPPGSFVLDMCAAPGMKTTQLAAYLRNNGKIYAVERDNTRYQTLCDFVEKTNSKCVHTYNRDCLDIKRGEFEDAEYILLDPSCSGSGMAISVHNYKPDHNRLDKLTSLQEKFLKHAMNSFPKAKRIVYSTCSLYPEENERVIANVVRTSRAKWRVQDVKELLKDQWNNYGSAMYGTTGTRCLYAKPESDLTTGFFLAVLDRDAKDLAKAHRQAEIEAREVEKANKKLMKWKGSKEENVEKAMEVEENAENETISKKKAKRVYENLTVDDDSELQLETENVQKKKKRKDEQNELKIKTKRKRENDDTLDSNRQSSMNTITDSLEGLIVQDETIEAPKKKKKKKDKYNNLDTTNNHDAVDIENGVEENVKKVKSKKKKSKNREGHEIDQNQTIELPDDQEESFVESSDITIKKKKKHQKVNVE